MIPQIRGHWPECCAKSCCDTVTMDGLVCRRKLVADGQSRRDQWLLSRVFQRDGSTGGRSCSARRKSGQEGRFG